MCVAVYVCVCVLLSYADYSQNRAQGADVKNTTLFVLFGLLQSAASGEGEEGCTGC